MERVYLDHAATTPLSPSAKWRIVEAMEQFGNPSSQHGEGRAAREIVDGCRAALLDAINPGVEGGRYEFSDVIFTSGGTEAANFALVGTALASPDPARTRIVISGADHVCTFGARALLERLGFLVEIGPVDRIGRLLPVPPADDLLAVSAMRVNNELGTVQDGSSVPEGAMHLMDGVQAFGRTPVGRRPACLWVSAHKIGGPKGVGALLLAPGVRIAPLISGGEQERERRGGTENVIGLAGFWGALEELNSQILPPSPGGGVREADGGGTPPTLEGGNFAFPPIGEVPSKEGDGGRAPRLIPEQPHPPPLGGDFPLKGKSGDGGTPPPSLRDTSPRGGWEDLLSARDLFWNRLVAGGGIPTVPDRSLVQGTHAHFRFPGIDAETLLLRLDREGVAASAGAACSSGSVEPSRVMLACGYSPEEAREGVRFSFGLAGPTVEEAERAAEIVVRVVEDVRRRRGR